MTQMDVVIFFLEISVMLFMALLRCHIMGSLRFPVSWLSFLGASIVTIYNWFRYGCHVPEYMGSVSRAEHFFVMFMGTALPISVLPVISRTLMDLVC